MSNYDEVAADWAAPAEAADVQPADAPEITPEIQAQLDAWRQGEQVAFGGGQVPGETLDYVTQALAERVAPQVAWGLEQQAAEEDARQQAEAEAAAAEAANAAYEAELARTDSAFRSVARSLGIDPEQLDRASMDAKAIEYLGIAPGSEITKPVTDDDLRVAYEIAALEAKPRSGMAGYDDVVRRVGLLHDLRARRR